MNKKTLIFHLKYSNTIVVFLLFVSLLMAQGYHGVLFINAMN